MVVSSVQVLSSTSVAGSTVTSGASALDVIHVTNMPLNTDNAMAVVEVVGPPVVPDAIVSATPPANPYEGMIWVDVS
jgi:hypothetical protein